MKPIYSLLILLLALSIIPQASAWHLSSFPNPAPGTEVDLRQRTVATRTVNLDNGAAGNLLTYTFPWDPEYSYTDIPSHTIRITISYTLQHASTSNGAWLINVAKEQTGNLDSCNIRVETVDPTGISLDALLMTQYYRWDCLFTQSNKIHPHNHTVYVNRTLAAGTPAAPTAETISVKLETEDVVVIPPPDLSSILNSISTHNTNNTDYHNHLNGHLHELDEEQQEALNLILEAISNLNMTIIGNVTGNFTLDNVTLSNIYNELLEHREASLEVFGMENILLLIFFLMMIISEWKKDMIYHVITVIVGIAFIASGHLPNLRLAVVGLIVYMIYRAYVTAKSDRNLLGSEQNEN